MSNNLAKPKLLIVEDDESIRSQMKWALLQDYEVFLVGDRAGAMEIIKTEKPPVVTLDLGLPPSPADTKEGFMALEEILDQDPGTKVVIITGQGEKNNALEAVGKGAYDFFCKPIQIDEIKVVLKRAFYISQLEKECGDLKQSLLEDSFEGILGTSPKMQNVFSTIRKVASADAPVLIVGESGTGKELVAKAIHKEGHRKISPFVVINCGAIPETLLESELFGHEKGSFTGAHIQRKGRFEMAQGGTLFLDEISELPLSLQVKLLRFLQDQKIERIGGREQIAIDTRILAATNRDLDEEIQKGRFREDLYYRLGVITISIPPLRKRADDVILLATAFLYKYAAENNKKISGFMDQAIQAMKNYDWPGNVRELENRLKRAVIMAEGKKISSKDLELSALVGYKGKNLREAREEVEKDLIKKSMMKNKGNLSRVAEELGVSRPTLYEMMEKLGINKQ